MRIGGLQKTSLIDYPGRVAAVVFTQGCNFRCPFCHNAELVLPSCFREVIEEDSVIRFLTTRIDKLQGVVVTGGEPAIQEDLPDFLQKIKAMGYQVKLDTNGSRPAVLKHLIDQKLVDFIAMDVKGPLDRYDDIAGVKVNPRLIEESIDLIIRSGVEYLFRTTFPKPLLGEQDIPGLLALVQKADHFHLQPFVPQEKILDPSMLDKAHYGDEEFLALCRQCELAAC